MTIRGTVGSVRTERKRERDGMTEHKQFSLSTGWWLVAGGKHDGSREHDTYTDIYLTDLAAF